jgi:hypothetical protein
MKELHANSLLPFVPSGKHYEGSRRLFTDLGFEEVWENNGYAGFRNGGVEFILQRFDDEHFAQNFMVRLNVEDWGREVTLIDLAGVCWHIGETKRPDTGGSP